MMDATGGTPTGADVRARVGGIAGILSAVCFLGSALVNGLVISNQGAYGWLGLFGTMLAIPFTWALYYRVVSDANRQTLQLAVILIVTGGILYTWLYLGALLDHAMTPLIEETGQQAEVLEALGNKISQASIITGTVYFIGVFLFAANGLRRDSGLRWANWVGVVGAALTVFWFGFGIVPEILSLVAAGGFMLTWVWMIAHGVRLLRGA
jgi:hypothetical protein